MQRNYGMRRPRLVVIEGRRKSIAINSGFWAVLTFFGWWVAVTAVLYLLTRLI
jgi:hypothetical protein